MESISSSTDYSAILENMLLTDVNQIRKSAILQHLGNKMAISTSIANDIASSLTSEGYQIDSEIPEGSTFSIHV